MTSGLFFSGIAVILGIFCAIFTDFSIKIVVIALGAMSVVKGIFDLIRFRKTLNDDSVFHRTILIRSAISIVVGLLAVTLPMAFFNTAETVVHVLLYVLGFFFLFNAGSGILMIRRLRNADMQTKTYSSSIVVYLLIAVLLFLLATIGVKNILRIAGIVLAVFGVVGCLYSWRNRPQELVPDSVEDSAPAEELQAEVISSEPVENNEETKNDEADESRQES